VKTVHVDLGDRSYDVRIGPGLLAEAGRTVAQIPRARAAVVISDTTVADRYGPAVVEALRAADVSAALLSFPAGEASKTLATCAALFDGLFAVEPAVDRDTVIVALGGGVPGDIAGFVAATALRGLRWVQVPTTLLADVDASVGGKTAVDHAAGKNLIGAFHQPAAVLIDVDPLRTLSNDELRNGLAECVKHGVIRDAALLDDIEAAAEAIFARDAKVLTDLVARNVAIKAAVVAGDERESGPRADLNFGHTVGHAIEAAVGYDRIRHGEGVSLGMVAACRLAAARKLISAADAARVEGLLGRLGLPVRRGGLDADALWAVMQHDKKARDGKVRMVLPVRLGAVKIFDDVTPAEIRRAIEFLRDTVSP